MMRPVSIYIIDDHQIVRRGLSLLLNSTEGFVVCGGTGDADMALRELNTLNPDVVIVDISLKGISGFEITKAIRERYKNILVLIHSMHNDSSYAERAIRLGARGYVAKSEPVGNVVKAINCILNGEIYINDDLKDELLGKFLKPVGDPDNFADSLTSRELDVFKGIGRGQSLKEIADSLGLSTKTVQTYRDRIKEKMHLKKSNELIRIAYQWVSSNQKDV